MLKKINVLQLLSSLQVGGLEKLLVDLIKSSENNINDVDFTIVVMNDEVNENLKQELLATKYNVYFLGRKEGHKSPKYLFQLLNIIRKHKIDVIHTHHLGSKHWSILCKLINPKIKLVYTIHDSVLIERFSKRQLFLHKNFVDMTIAISEAIYQDCLKNRILRTKKIYNGIDLKKLISKSLDNDNRIFKIVNIARLTYYKKGQDVLLKALKVVKDKGLKFSFDFVGGVYEYDVKSLEYLKNLVSELDLDAEINFLGNRNNIAELLSQADLFVLPSRFEGFPISILEAMASKLPIIVSDISGSNELIRHEENGLLFESENHIELAKMIMCLLENQEKREYFANNAYEDSKRFDISVMSQEYRELYKYLV